jgi:hypothetical protein
VTRLRTLTRIVLLAVLFLLMFAVALIVVDERLSRQLDDNDLTVEEIQQDDFAPGAWKSIGR